MKGDTEAANLLIEHITRPCTGCGQGCKLRGKYDAETCRVAVAMRALAQLIPEVA